MMMMMMMMMMIMMGFVNCQHQIVHTSFNLDIYYPIPYQRLIWDYKKADSTNIRKALDSVNWERLFDKKDLNPQVVTLNETILYVFKNYVPCNYITIDDKDRVWMKEIIKLKKTIPAIYPKWKV